MKFGLLLSSHMVAEWRQYYISYELLKDFIEAAVIELVLSTDKNGSKLGSINANYGTVIDDDDGNAILSFHKRKNHCQLVLQFIMDILFWFLHTCHIHKGDAEVLDTQSTLQKAYTPQPDQNLIGNDMSDASLSVENIAVSLSPDNSFAIPMNTVGTVPTAITPPPPPMATGEGTSHAIESGTMPPNFTHQSSPESGGRGAIDSSPSQHQTTENTPLLYSDRPIIVKKRAKLKRVSTAPLKQPMHTSPPQIVKLQSLPELHHTSGLKHKPMNLEYSVDSDMESRSHHRRKEAKERQKNEAAMLSNSKMLKRDRAKERILDIWQTKIRYESEKVTAFYSSVEMQLESEFDELSKKLKRCLRIVNSNHDTHHNDGGLHLLSQYNLGHWHHTTIDEELSEKPNFRAEIRDAITRESDGSGLDTTSTSQKQYISPKEVFKEATSLTNRQMEEMREASFKHVFTLQSSPPMPSGGGSGTPAVPIGIPLGIPPMHPQDPMKGRLTGGPPLHRLRSSSAGRLPGLGGRKKKKKPDFKGRSMSSILLQPIPMPSSYQQESRNTQNMHLYQLKLNAFILYHRLVALSNFASLNRTGFSKICKKFDKNLDCKLKQSLLDSVVDQKEVITSKKCVQLQNALIDLYAQIWEDGNVDRGKVALLESIRYSTWSRAAFFRMGIKLGIIGGLMSWVIFELVKHHHSRHLPPHAFYVYRSVGCFIAWMWFWAADVYIWSSRRINYVFIFEFDPRSRLTYFQLFDAAANMSLIYLANFLIYLLSYEMWDPQFGITMPSAMLIFVLLKLFTPSLMGYWQSRKCLIVSFYQTIIAPFGRVRFRDFYFGDVLTSTVKVLGDFYMACCVLIRNEYETPDGESWCDYHQSMALPIIICLPYWFRFMQCINRYWVTGDRVPHLPNAFKYALAMSVTLLGTLNGAWSHYGQDWTVMRVVWFSCFFLSTSYISFWDIFMDWKLFRFCLTQTTASQTGSNASLSSLSMQSLSHMNILGRSIEYPLPWYILAIILDLCLRFLWTFTLLPTGGNPYFAAPTSKTAQLWFLAVIEVAELFRRAMWGVFRVENAHVTRKHEFTQFMYVPLLYEHMNLQEEQSSSDIKTSKVLIEISVMVGVVLVIISVIWATYGA